ncbi:hypothetical protein EJ04DRAFT_9181 [Polyplosphaeria fusca]|uniref:DNA polymerase delta subunit 3 n=1 Tax=Polyplosphaeria fusca TaxID=682080 RepID=A0A9P4R4N1_9PLEO|nr:hypothetical protein EJ04DRAFT_9181 [Polyplosphaeria fusca]
MAENYKEFLAERVVSGAQPVTYRLLSRALKTNVNIAKQMLFDFHAKQNAKKPNSVHATYLLTGKKRTHEHTNGANGSRQDGDIPMQSSPYMSSMPEPTEEPSAEPTPKTSIVLVREEEMEKTQAEFEEVTSIHIYSVEPGPIENMNVLSVCNQEIATHQAGEDPMDRWRTYGGINNPHVKRRTTKYAPPNVVPAQTATLKPTTKAAAPSLASKETSGPEGSGSVSEGNTSGRSTPQPTLSATSKKSDAKSTLRKDKSDIFKSFAKAKPKLKEAGLAKESTPAPAEDGQPKWSTDRSQS